MASQKPCDSLLSGKSEACPLRGDWISFQLVDENGDGKPYADLTYILQDSAHQQYIGVLDANGSAKVMNHYQGPVVLMVDSPYKGSENVYNALLQRGSYPLPITELQVRAEKPVLCARMDSASKRIQQKKELSSFSMSKLKTL